MNGATSKSFMKNLSGSDFTSHRSKKRYFEAADVNKAVGMEKGKLLFTQQHHLSPHPSIDINAVAKDTGRGVKADEHSIEGGLHGEGLSGGKNTPRPIGGYTAEEQKARINVQMNEDFELDRKPGDGHGGSRMARQEGTALEESSNSSEDDTTKDKKEKVNLNIQPGKATIVAMQRGRHKY